MLNNNILITIALLGLLYVNTGCEELNEMPMSEPYNPVTGLSTVDYLRSIAWDGDTEYDLMADLLVRSGVDLEGKTLFAPADNNWEQWMSDNGYASVDEVPVDVIRDVMLNHIVEGRKKRWDLDEPDRNPQTLAGEDVPSQVTSLSGNTLLVNVSFFGNVGRGHQMSVGTNSPNKLVMVGDIENTDAIVHLYGFSNTRGSDKGLLLP